MNVATSELFSIQICILSLLNMDFTSSDFEYLLSNNLPEMLVSTCKLHVPFMFTDRYSLVVVKMTSNILYILAVSGWYVILINVYFIKLVVHIIINYYVL